MAPRSSVKKLKERISELEASLEEERKTSERYLNQLKYARADLENLQKRTQKSIDQALERANGRLIMQLLPTLDELDLAISAAKKSEGGILEGVEMVRGKLWKLLTAEGVTPINAVGEPFDPNLHEAVQDVETSEHPESTVVEEFMKGYKYKDRVLRASMVKVARSPSSEKDQEDVENE